MVVHLAVACDVFDCVLFLCCPFTHEISWIRSRTELSQFHLLLVTESSAHLEAEITYRGRDKGIYQAFQSLRSWGRDWIYKYQFQLMGFAMPWEQ